MDQQEQINRYLQGRMTKEEQHTFETRMQHDYDLRQDVVLWQGIASSLEPAASDDLKARLKPLGQKYVQQQKRKTLVRWTVVLLALVALAISLWINNQATPGIVHLTVSGLINSLLFRIAPA